MIIGSGHNLRITTGIVGIFSFVHTGGKLDTSLLDDILCLLEHVLRFEE